MMFQATKIPLSFVNAERPTTTFFSRHSVECADVTEQHINYLMKMALKKASFLPFALIMDKWRFEVFRGDVSPAQYNSRWWRLR